MCCYGRVELFFLRFLRKSVCILMMRFVMFFIFSYYCVLSVVLLRIVEVMSVLCMGGFEYIVCVIILSCDLIWLVFFLFLYITFTVSMRWSYKFMFFVKDCVSVILCLFLIKILIVCVLCL